MGKTKSIFIVALITLISVPLGKLIWPPAAEIHTPTPLQLPFFIVLGLFEGFALCAGVVFALQVRTLIKKLPQTDQKRFKIMAVCIAWSLINWWAHDNLHIHNGENIIGLLFIEYGFHVTLIISGLVLAYNFYQLLAEKSTAIR